MPRPGPRPYECVRRPWHSDRHGPIRGSIIQQIFRVVHESHSSATKKNKEWQKKLPIVVLKAEEIMYSKANSEAEYMDLENIRYRVNDAIDTIIRRNENTETGKLLPPCVEAALNLGCVPVRASRSQRITNPGSYVSPRTQPPPKSSYDTTDKQNPNSLSLRPGNQLILSKPMSVSSAYLVSESDKDATENDYSSSTVVCNVSSSCERFIPLQSNPSLSMGSVYPLYYGTGFQPKVSTLGFQSPKYSSTIIVGRPVFPLVAESVDEGCLQNPLVSDQEENDPKRVCQIDMRSNHEKATEKDCDLSLQLGLSLTSSMSKAKGSVQSIYDFCPSSSQEWGRFNDLPFPQKEFSFFPEKDNNNPFG